MKRGVKDLCFMALYAAIFIVLDYVGNLIPFLKMPQGGSIGIGTISLLLASYHLGWRKGVMVGLLSIPLQYITGAVYIQGLLGLAFDYLVPFGIYGIACLFPNIKGIYTGVIVTNFIRFICHVYTGVVIWETTLEGSIIYNGPYMLATCVVGILLVPLLNNRLKAYLN